MTITTPANPAIRLTRPILATKLRAALGANYVLDRPEELMLYEYDGSALDMALPELVVVPASATELAEAVRIASDANWPIIARGAGTGLSGGSVPSEGGVVISVARLERLLRVDVESRLAVVQPGMVNVDLSEQIAHLGLHFAPDPSSQKASTIGGNAAENAGGPHCLKYGVTTSHIISAEVALSDGTLIRLGSEAPDAPGYDLLGAFVGSEGTIGIATELTVRLTPNPEAVRTFLAIYDDLDAASDTVSAIIAGGIIPAALEMLEGEGIRVVEEAVHAGYPTDARAVLLIEIDGLHEELEAQAAKIAAICSAHGARELRAARDEDQRKKLWAGRKGALAACGRLRPHYHIQDGVVPRSKLTEVLRVTEEVAARYNLLIVNIFHAGDGNLHPLLLFDVREPGVRERAVAAGEEILRACVDAGGTISGEHGIGIEKRDYMAWIYTPEDIAAMLELRAAFDPRNVMNPCKQLPTGASCGDIKHAKGAAHAVAAGAWI
ncbi:MAG: FAD-linked oxidase C-terminal domain-containing protein [Roseiflexaceae bacterium]|nr:FAD-linked oxidase C-terminal domain-containing protein [Roseiflexaceae bacterium]